jgi:hypothetical protein
MSQQNRPDRFKHFALMPLPQGTHWQSMSIAASAALEIALPK